MARRPPPPPGPARWLAHDLAAGARDLIVACVDLALPPTCAGCGWPGTTWCAICRATLAQDRFPRGVARVSPTPIPVGFPDAWAAVPYEGVVRTMLSAYKDDGRRDLAPVLAGLLLEPLAAAAAAAAAAGGEVLVVPVPSSPAARRRRGDCPLAAVVRLATRPAGGTRCETGLLRVARRVADQAGLASGARAANLAGAFVAVPVDGRPVIVVDDVVTTGATLAEAARALREAGAGPVFAACVAATRRRPASAEMPT